MSARGAPRGFGLVIVAICGVALVTIATAIVVTAGAAQIVATKAAAMDQAQTIAEAGMERATAYVSAVATAETDFDFLLDTELGDSAPGPGVDCTAYPSVTGTGGSPARRNIPRYSDLGGGISFIPASGANAMRFYMTPYNDGAYFTRFDDDFDDDVVNGMIPGLSNRVNGAKGCLEGPTAPEGNNPYRDRNAGVYITVVGIYPGTDPARAQRVTLRRFYTAFKQRPSTPVVKVEQHLNTTGNGALVVCTDKGHTEVWDDFDNDGQYRTCGALVVDPGGSVAGSGVDTGPSNPADCGTLSCLPHAPVSRASVPIFTDPVTVPGPQSPAGTTPWFEPDDPALYDFATPCNIYLEPDKSGGNSIPYGNLLGGTTQLGGMFFWDHTYPGCAAATTFVKPSASGLGRCWVPLAMWSSNAIGAGTIAGMPAIGANWVMTLFNETTPASQLVGAAMTDVTWNPSSAAQGPVAYPVVGDLTRTVTKPDWDTECPNGTANFGWRPPAGGDDPSCSCDGTTVLRYINATPRFEFIDAPDKWPVSVVYLHATMTDTMTGCNPTDVAKRPTLTTIGASSAWSNFTLAVEGTFVIDGAQRWCGGIGTSHATYASLVVKGGTSLFQNNTEAAFAGSVWTSGRTEYKNNTSVTMYGGLFSDDHVEIDNNSLVKVIAMDDIFVGGAAIGNAPVPTPVLSRSVY